MLDDGLNMAEHQRHSGIVNRSEPTIAVAPDADRCSFHSRTATSETSVILRDVPWNRPRSVYVHVPFCAHKCGYCDFASVAGHDNRAADYLMALDAEMAAVLHEPRHVVRTIFIGGGTPTYLAPADLAKLLEWIHHWFDVDQVEEFTVESNPNTLDGDRVSILADHGVNRVSLGAQSFHPHLLARLERNHEPLSVGRAMDLLRPRIENVSIDLIFGVPDQTLAEWQADLDQALALAPSHLSTYGLTYEKGTRLWRQRQLSLVRPVAEELERSMYELALDRVPAAGLNHYEIANFARSGANGDLACRHNLVYWANHAYYGFGTGAAAFVAGTRTLNTRDLESYISRCRTNRSPVSQSESLAADERARETAMLNLRRTRGIHRAEFQAQTGMQLDDLAGAALQPFLQMDLLKDDGESIRLTREGLFVADGIMAALL